MRTEEQHCRQTAVGLEKTLSKLAAGDPLRIVALGDSLTYGWMAARGYLDFLKEMLSAAYPRSVVDIINRGIPGDTAAGGLHRLAEHVLEFKPDLVLVQFALNDAFTGCSPVRFQHNIRSIILEIKAGSSAEILLLTSVALGSTDDNRFIEPYYNGLDEVARQEAVPLARVHRYWQKKIDAGVAFGSLVQEDGVHPTVAGYRLMAEAVMEAL